MNERFQKSNETDELGRVRLTYRNDLSAILGKLETNKDVSTKDSAAVGFPVFAAFVTRPGAENSPEYVEDVLEALKDKSDKYYIEESDRHLLVQEGIPIISSFLGSYFAAGDAGRIMSGVLKNTRRIRSTKQIPIIVKTMPSSHIHAQEIGDAVIATMRKLGHTNVISDVRELNKVELSQARDQVKFIPDDTAVRKWESEGGIIKGETLEQWAHEMRSKNLIQWIRSMERKGKTHFSISDVPSEFRRHIRGFIQPNKTQPDIDPSLPYILIIADDNIESGISMREAAASLVDHVQNKPIITVGVVLINLTTSWSNGAPRRGSMQQSHDKLAA
jgi:hypothetical protein